MANRLKGRNAVVTGAGSGIGKAVSLSLAKEGANIVACDLGGGIDGKGASTSPADQTANECKALGVQAIAQYGSVADFKAAEAMIKACVEKFGRIDVLVNVAGIDRAKMLWNLSEEDWDVVIAVHLKGTFNTIRHAAPFMREQKYGRIVNTISEAWVGTVGHCNYGAAKGGIAALTMVWGRELSKYGVTSNAVAPMARSRMTLGSSTTAGIMGEKAPADGSFDIWAPENLSPLIVYLASDQAADITGRIFTVMGGKITLFMPWVLGKSVDIGKRWTEQELHKRIRELGDLTMPPFPY